MKHKKLRCDRQCTATCDFSSECVSRNVFQGDTKCIVMSPVKTSVNALCIMRLRDLIGISPQHTKHGPCVHGAGQGDPCKHCTSGCFSSRTFQHTSEAPVFKSSAFVLASEFSPQSCIEPWCCCLLKIVLFFQNHSKFVNAVRYSPDGTYFVTAGADCKVSDLCLQMGPVESWFQFRSLCQPENEGHAEFVLCCRCSRLFSTERQER